MSQWKPNHSMDDPVRIVIGLKSYIELLKDQLNKHDQEKMPFDLLVLEKLEQLMEDHYRQQKEQAFYCQQLNINLYRLNVMVKHHVGKTLYALLQDRLHQQARILLAYTNQSVKEIAFELGFSDHPYFTRHFKKREGVSPTAYRKTFGQGVLFRDL